MNSHVSSVTREEFKTLIIVILMASCGMLGVDIHLPSLPHIMHYLHTDQAHMQQSIAGFLLGMGLSLLVYGPLSDAYGRKPLVLLGLSLAALASFACAFSTSIESFLFWRMCQGVGSGVCLGLGRTIAVDVLHGERFATIGSYFAMGLSLSPLLAPALGGYLEHHFGWQANFIFLGTVIVAVLILYALFCPETNKHLKPFTAKQVVVDYKFLLRSPVFICFTVLSGLAMAANMAYATSSSFIMQMQFHLTPIVYGWVSAAVGLASLFGKFFGPIAIRRLGSENTLFLGMALILLASVLLGMLIITGLLNVFLLIGAVMVTIIGQIFIAPTASARALSPFHDKRGAAGALFGGFQMLVAFMVSALMGMLAFLGASVLAMAYAVIAVLAGIVYYGLVGRRAKRSS